MKLVRIENDSAHHDKGKKVDGAPPMIFQRRVIEDSVVNAMFILLKLCQDSAEAAIVPLARWQKSLPGSGTPPPTEWCDESGKMVSNLRKGTL